MSLLMSLLNSRWRIWRLKHCLRFEPEPKSGTHASARIYNDYIFPLHSAFAYITIDHQSSDILVPPPGMSAFVNKDWPRIVKEDRLCWSFATKSNPNPACVDIYSKERQALAIVNVNADWIEFPSEDGWSTLTNGVKISRVFLARKKYDARIKIVSEDSKAKTFDIVIDPDNLNSPIILLRYKLLERFRQWCRPSH